MSTPEAKKMNNMLDGKTKVHNSLPKFFSMKGWINGLQHRTHRPCQGPRRALPVRKAGSNRSYRLGGNGHRHR
ncbi:MAG: hypothetical protein COB65_01305, partial [Thalassobium sp.]